MTQPSDRRMTIADLAKAAGVSRTTVSHALNDRGKVDPRTRHRVKAMAAELGYRPNVRAQRLRNGQARTIALVSSMPLAIAAGPSRLGFFMEVAAAAAETALTHGYALVLVPPLEVRPSLDYLDIDGAIVVEPDKRDPATDQLLGRGLSTVTIGRQTGANPDVPFMDLQPERVSRILLDHLDAMHAQRIALLIGESRRDSYLAAERVYREFVAARDQDAMVAKAKEADGEQAGYQSCTALLQRFPDLDAVLAPVDAFAVGAVHALADAGRRVPDDVMVVTRYDGLRARTCQPALTAVNLHLGQLASSAVELLLEHIQGHRTRRVATASAPELVPRASSARMVKSTTSAVVRVRDRRPSTA